jgi:hypothetical protein
VCVTNEHLLEGYRRIAVTVIKRNIDGFLKQNQLHVSLITEFVTEKYIVLILECTIVI